MEKCSRESGGPLIVYLQLSTKTVGTNSPDDQCEAIAAADRRLRAESSPTTTLCANSCWKCPCPSLPTRSRSGAGSKSGVQGVA